MKPHNLNIVLLLFLFISLNLLIVNVSYSQWQADVRLTYDPADSYTSSNNAWCVAANGNFVHVVWYDRRDGNSEIYYKRSTDEGVNWGTDTRLTNNTALSVHPSVAVSGSVVHMVWGDDRGGNGEIYYKRSTDAGSSWGQDTRLTNNSFTSMAPSTSVSGSFVHVVWFDFRNQNTDIYYKRSTDGGVNWGADTQLTNNTAPSMSPSIAVSGSVTHVVWFDFRDGNNGEIYYKCSTNGGTSWGADTRLTNNSAHSQSPSVAASGSMVHVVWYDGRDGNEEIYYKRSTDEGVSWGADTRLTNDNARSQIPSVTVSSQAVHVVWLDGDWNAGIYYKRSTDGGLSWAADTRLTNDPSTTWNPSVSASGPVVHVVWSDYRDDNLEIYYKRDPTGNPIGVKKIATEIPKEFYLYQNYPNPFNPVTKIKFDLPQSPLYERGEKGGFVTLTIYDILGRELATLVNEQLKPGTYEVEWSAANYPSGVYFYELSTARFTETKRMILMK